MFGRLKVLHPRPGLEVGFRPGDRVRVGRLERDNDLAVPDPFLAPTHFVLECGPAACTLRDASAGVHKHGQCKDSCFVMRLRNAPCPGGLCRANDMSGETGIYVNRQKVSEAALANGDAVVAGTSCFVVELSETPLAAPPEAKAEEEPALRPEGQKAVFELLARMGLPTFALVDAARDKAALDALRVSGEIHYSLYDGPEGDKLEEVAPYLVELPAGSALAERLVRRDWGKSSFCLLASSADFKALRRHLRRFLMVEDPDGQPMYFRFYDPRVLRDFLPTCTPAECAEFFGPITGFVVESENKAGAYLFARDREGQLRRTPLRF